MSLPIGATVCDAHAIDHYLETSAPPWLKAAPPASLALLRRSLEQHRQAQQRVLLLLGRLPSPDGFTRALLTPALTVQFGAHIDPDRVIWCETRPRLELPLFTATQWVPSSQDACREPGTLLQRAMQNFDADEGDDDRHPAGTWALLEGVALNVRPGKFASLCHTLDIGGQYQCELNALLQREEVLGDLAANHRHGLLAQAHCSRLQGVIDPRIHYMIVRLCEEGADSTFETGGARIRCTPLKIRACEVLGALAFELSEPLRAGMGHIPAVYQVVVYLPGDPCSPLRSFTSSFAAAAELERLLENASWRRYFLSLLGIEDRHRFLAQLSSSHVAQRMDMPLQGVPVAQPLFRALAQQQVSRIKADAAVLVVPSAEADRRAYRARMTLLWSVGKTLAQTVASFLPVVGEVMLLSMAHQLLSQVYEGISDWTHGQREQALEHLLDVAENLAAAAVLAAGGAAAVKVLKRRPFVDRLVPVQLEQGGQRLWNQDLTPYQANRRPAYFSEHGEGLWCAEGRYWLDQGERLFEVTPDSRTGRWRIRHSERAQAYAPHLEHTGHGGWLLPGEQPLQWRGLEAMVRRLGPSGARWSDADCRDIALIAQVDENRVRSLLVGTHALPAALQETMQRFHMDARVAVFVADVHRGAAATGSDRELYLQASALFAPGEQAPASIERQLRQNLPQQANRLFEHMLGLQQPVLGADGAALQRAFAPLPAVYVQRLIEASGAAAQRALRADASISTAVTTQARRMQRDSRICRALLGLRLRHDYSSDSVRLAFALLRRLPEWPQGLNIELYEGSLNGRAVESLLPAGEARETRILLRGTEGFEVFASKGGEPGQAPPNADFLQAIAASLNPEQRRALGWQTHPARLRMQLYEQAMTLFKYRDQWFAIAPSPAAFRPPRRQPDGRIGYALSGRGAQAQASLTGMVRGLFPGMDALQVAACLQRMGEGGGNVMQALAALEQEYAALDTVLTRWRAGATGNVQRVRERVAQALRRCWRRLGERVYENNGSLAGYRLRINDINLDDLPALPAGIDFSHVVDVNLAGTGLSLDTCQILQNFTGVRWLDLSDCALTDVPESLVGMGALTELQLQNNRIQLSSLGAQRLGALVHLRSLNLEGNPLGDGLDVSAMADLQEVMLRATGLSTLPRGLLGCSQLELADLRDNFISQLPEPFFAAPARMRIGIVLHDNPLNAQALARIGGLDNGRGQVSIDEGRRVWLASTHSETLVQRDSVWDSLRAEPMAFDFFRLLADMTQTAEFQRGHGDLQRRVWDMLEAAHENAALRQELFTLAAHPTTCIDSVALVFSDLEVRLQVFLLRSRTQALGLGHELLAFARRLFRLDQVERLAAGEIARRRASGREVDEVEVSLAYRTGLARELDLPGQPRHMQFVEVAGVSERDLAATQEAVEAAERSAQLAEFIGACDFWVDSLREQHGQAFAAVEDDFWARLERVTAQQDSLPEGDYLSQMNQLAREREQALQALALRLTQEALARETG